MSQATTELITFIGLTLDLLGVLLIAYAALSVHHRFRHEHQVDDEVFNAMQREQIYGIVGVSLIIIAYGFQTFLYLFA